MDRRQFTASLAALASAIGLTPRQVEAAPDQPPDFPFYHFSPVVVIRLEEDGTFSAFDGYVSGAVRRPTNHARERRLDIGPDHWNLLVPVDRFDVQAGHHDEAYYEERYPRLAVTYHDETRISTATLDLFFAPHPSIMKVHSVSHVSDPGGGVHRWVFPGEDWQGIAWKHALGSVSPELHFIWRRQYGWDHHLWR